MRKPAKTFEDLIVWQKAHKFVFMVYKYTSTFPKSEMYGLTSQFRRAALSIAANIAEGFKKRQSQIHEYFPWIIGRMQILPHTIKRFRLRKE